MARVLLVGGGCRGRQLTAELMAAGHAVRATTRTEAGRAAIEATGAECWIGTPDRIASLRYALENVTALAWLLGTARGEPEGVAALHGSRLAFMLSQTIDTTIRGVLYEARGSVAPQVLEQGGELARAHCAYNAIPYGPITVDPADGPAWVAAVHAQLDQLLSAAVPPADMRLRR
ncbi:MAG TPA: hypothetical protein VHX88_13115 [Solirubrobacteraceae bacterium]|jgi:hypothetical protein|nr:hypothetical protein [Solirubrobacteraceae bacterium]